MSKVRVQLVLMIDATAQIDELKQDLRGLDWAGLVGFTQEGIDPEPFLHGGFNPMQLLVQETDGGWREEPF